MKPPLIGEHFVKMPQEIWDENIDLSLGEFRLLGYLLRHQLRCRNQRILVTQDELLNGRKMPDGSRMDCGCGITNPTRLIEARKRLEERGWLRVAREDGGRSMVYEALARDFDDDTKMVPTVSTEMVPKQSLFGTETVPKRYRQYKEVEDVEAVRRKPSPASRKEVDSRHQEFKEEIQRQHQKNTGEPCAWDGAEAGQLGRVLKRYPELKLWSFKRWLQNYWESDPRIRMGPAVAYLAKIEKFMNGPRDEFWKQTQGQRSAEPEKTLGDIVKEQLSR